MVARRCHLLSSSDLHQNILSDIFSSILSGIYSGIVYVYLLVRYERTIDRISPSPFLYLHSVQPAAPCRMPRTTTTVSWITGDMGFAYVTVPEGSLDPKEMQAMNDEFEGMLVIDSSSTDSHMWSGPTCIRFFENLTIELRKRRAAIGCQDVSERALLFCDRCTSHLSKTYLDLRRQWASQQNVLLAGTDPTADVQVPGGWGLTSSPNDAWHGHFHQLRMAYMRAAMRLPLNPLHCNLADFEISCAGIPSLMCPMRTSLCADAWALQNVAKIGSGKTLLWAWITRGYLEPKVAADWHFEGGEGCYSVLHG